MTDNDQEYKTICDSCGKKTWYETTQPCKMTIFKGCENCGSHEFISNEAKCTGMLRVIDNSNLLQRATRYYKSGERVLITYKDRSKVRCYVGKSTGWKPVYLEILRSNSSGGSSLYLPEDAQITGLGIFNR